MNSYDNESATYHNLRQSSAHVGTKKEEIFVGNSSDNFNDKNSPKNMLQPQNEVTEDEITIVPRRNYMKNTKKTSPNDSKSPKQFKIPIIYHNPADERVINPNLFNKLNNRSNVHN